MQKSFQPGKYQTSIDVRDFIQTNYTPYEGGAEFLAPPTARTKALMEKVNALLKAESDKGGVLDVDTEHVSSLLTYPAGYIDRGKRDHCGIADRRAVKARGKPVRGDPHGAAGVRSVRLQTFRSCGNGVQF